MFRCSLCSRVAPPRTPVHHLVVASRRRHYPHRSRANVVRRWEKDRKKKEYHTDDPGGDGVEIVREVMICPECARKQGAT
jgi:hypothetical protein